MEAGLHWNPVLHSRSPLTYGLEIHGQDKLTPYKKSTYDPVGSESTRQLTPASGGQNSIDVRELPSELSEIIVIWLQLPLYIRQALSTLARVGADAPGQ